MIPDDFHLWLYDGEGNYRPQVVLVLAQAEKVRKAGRGYREFRRRLGNYANGKGVMKDQTNLWIGAILADSPSTPERILDLRNECVKVCKFLWEFGVVGVAPLAETISASGESQDKSTAPQI